MLPLALRSGISYQDFWHMTPRAIRTVVKAYDDNVRFASDMEDLNAWRIGQYVSMACFNSKNYPKSPMFQLSEKSEEDVGEKNELLAVAEMKQFANVMRQQGLKETIMH